MPLAFEWHELKQSGNVKKHGVSFAEACTVFDDPLAAIFRDDDHSIEEAREVIIGHSILNRMLLVCFTERSREMIRIFSARPATRRERQDYEKYFERKE
jgi:uncharacterized DUF497 family protein